MKTTMEIMNELNAQTEELRTMNLPIEDKLILYRKLIRKVDRVRIGQKIESFMLNVKMFCKAIRTLIRVTILTLK